MFESESVELGIIPIGSVISEIPCFNVCKIPDEYPGKTNYCFKRKYIKEYFSTLRDLSQLKLSTHYYNKRKKLWWKYKSGTSSAFL